MKSLLEKSLSVDKENDFQTLLETHNQLTIY